MYLDLFGMRELPFTQSPNIDFLVDLDAHRKALEHIHAALQQPEAIVTIIGVPGTGKSLLCQKLLNSLDERFIPVVIMNPFLSPGELLLVVASSIDIELEDDVSLEKSLEKIRDGLIGIKREQRKTAIIIVDEAQAIANESVNIFFQLIDLEYNTKKLMQAVLIGQPELTDLLEQEESQSLQKRIFYRCILLGLKPRHVFRYINHRVRRSGHGTPNLFSPPAIRLIADISQGNPSLINVLCHKSLLQAFKLGDKSITYTHVEKATEEIEGLAMPTIFSRLYRKANSVTGAIVIAVVLAAVYIMGTN